MLRFGIANHQPDHVGPEIQQKRESCGGLRSGIIVRPMNKMWTSGLYELNINAGTSVATLIPVAGTITKRDSDEIAPDGTFLGLRGADGDQLVVQSQGDGWDLSWARVSACVTTAD